MSNQKSFHFEKSLTELEKIVTDMEKGELSLEESLQKFEDGIKLTKQCHQALHSAEQTVKKLIESNGSLETEDFNSGEVE